MEALPNTGKITAGCSWYVPVDCFMLAGRQLATNAMSRAKSVEVGCGLCAYILNVKGVWWLSIIGIAHRHRKDVSLSCVLIVRIVPWLPKASQNAQFAVH